MNTIIIIGMTGEGKSEFVKKYIGKNRNCLVMDIQNEYGPKTKYPGQIPMNLSTNTKDRRSRYVGGDIREYSKIVLTKQNTICVFEEATVFFQGATDRTIRSILINKMFTKNVYILLFHSINSLPPRFLELCNYVILYRTNDEDYRVEKKFPSLYPDFMEAKKTLQKGEYKTIKLIT